MDKLLDKKRTASARPSLKATTLQLKQEKEVKAKLERYGSSLNLKTDRTPFNQFTETKLIELLSKPRGPALSSTKAIEPKRKSLTHIDVWDGTTGP